MPSRQAFCRLFAKGVGINTASIIAIRCEPKILMGVELVVQENCEADPPEPER
jgi:hypothetical protein